MTSATDSPLPAVTRLIATDLDGTLLRDDKTLSDRTTAALAAAEEAGIEVFFVTGRPARWMEVVSPHVQGHGMAICANGAAVVDLHDGTLIDVHPLDRGIALAVVDILRESAPGVSFAVELATGIHYEPAYPPFHMDPGATVAIAEKLLHEEVPGTGAPVLKVLAHHPELAPDAFLTLARELAGTGRRSPGPAPPRCWRSAGSASPRPVRSPPAARNAASPRARWSRSGTCPTMWRC